MNRPTTETDVMVLTPGQSVVDHMAQPSGNHEPTDPPNPAATCCTCRRPLLEGESAWAEDWRVIDTSGTSVAFRIETRYTCDDCAEAAS